ncbi:hypothetical protein [Sporosarcina luteola]|uniref:hypothetical protein n=1 Tax=Sporosarcina luteola TaxID=582850 RepID=UPI00203ADDE7|nr:hypothetical protein [Sporosarcina luteola]MCM3711051.1 hypothetical protein [Sporosarcina luteola]
MVLSAPLSMQENSLEKNLSYTYGIFNSIFIHQAYRPEFEGKTIYFEVSKTVNGITYPYPEKLMHIVSLEEKREHTILPCNNDVASISCSNQCEFAKAHILFVPLQRNECLYRMARIHWIPEIIDLANKKDPRVDVWVEKKKNKHNKFVEKTYIRFREGIIDYLIILAHRKRRGVLTNYIFDSAFPVFLNRSKKQYSQKYESYIRTLQTN